MKRGVILRIVDLLVTIVSIVLIAFLFKLKYFNGFDSNLFVWLLTYTVYFLMYGEIFELYHIAKSYDLYFTIRSVFLTAIFTTVSYIFTPIIAPVLPNSRIEILLIFQTILWSLLLWRILYITFFFHPIFLKKVLIIGESEDVEKLVDITSKYSSEYSIVGYVSSAKIDAIGNQIAWYSIHNPSLEEIISKERVTTLIICGKAIKDSFQVYSHSILRIFEQGVVVISNNEFVEQLTKRIAKSRLNDSFYDYFTYSKYINNTTYLSFIRIFDILFALIGLLFLLVIIPIIIVINHFLNKGPLFYDQKRVGKNGIIFKIYKLRTMIEGAEKGLPLWATKDDLRITPFGKFLRKSRIDELPQCYNVLIGEMRVIGPRPERPTFVKMLEEKLPFYAIRHVIKPGLTGWAQVEYPYANTVEDQEVKLCYDLYYIKERNLLMDIKIILKTVNTVLFYKGY
ncbi:MAG: exopolysaccharide biosynthesis polyprenyl glycosylphosphotransferase [Flavobacteriaceae bacterium]|nr:exopolysaccharide biosynthesis polyprenyl glycosylphosphotransferase [Flavobacteriaceae bacterium]